ncbi:MAG: CocE/NonD family hydrolase [Cyanobacteria bacterium P01_D01_bin.128]
MLTRDRVRLDADVYYPDAEGTFPVLLMRQPYGRAIASTVVYAHPAWYAAHGYMVVIQDVRGRGTSEGEFRLFRHEINDGADTVAWAAQLPQSSGQVGMYGFSYQGMTQLYGAQTRPEALKAIAPAMVGYDIYRDWAYENGALLLQAGLGWAIQLAAETARLKGDREAYQALFAASRQLPLSDPNPACPEVLKRYAPDSFFHDWVTHPYPDAYWQALMPDLSEVDLPMLHIGGWFDPYLRGNIRLFQHGVKQAVEQTVEGRDRDPSLHHLWIGPWAHIPWGRKVGQRDFGAAAESPIDRLQVRWFDHHLKQPDPDLAAAPPVHLFEMGSDRWQDFPRWPAGDALTYWLRSSGLATLQHSDGELVTAPATRAEPQSDLPDYIVHDPWRPAPALGGHSASPSGSFDRSAFDCRSDLATYTSEPLLMPLAIAGEVSAQIYCSADAPSFDLSVVLSEVYPNGRVYNLTQGYVRLQQSAVLPVNVPLQPTCFRVPPGNCIRLTIGAACFPAYDVNPGFVADLPVPNLSAPDLPGPPPASPAPAIATKTMDAKIITLAIYHSYHYPSQLKLTAQ